MTVQDLRDRIEELSQALIPIAAESPCKDKEAEMLRVLEGAFRKNLKRVQAIRVLSVMPQQGSSALELARNMLEDVISIEYMLAKDGDKMATRFHEFRWVQLHEDLQYYRSVGVDMNDADFPDTEANIEKEYRRVVEEYPDFLDKNGNPKRSWAGRDVDMMLASVIKKKVLKPREQVTITRSYTEGSRKTHFNPIDNMSRIDPTLWEFSNQQANKLSLLSGLSSMIRLTTRFIDLISQTEGRNTHHDVAAIATRIFGELDKATDIDD